MIKTIRNNLLLFLGIVLALYLVIAYGLKIYTRHNAPSIEVPNLYNQRLDQVSDILKEKELLFEVIDTVFHDEVKKLGVVTQSPEAGSKVKSGRTIFLTICSAQTPMVSVPDMAGKTSLKQAENMLKRTGLKLGRVMKRQDPSVSSEHDKPVLAQLIHLDSNALKPGTRIEKWSKIDLIVGTPVQETIEKEPENPESSEAND